jgi:adenylate cyclase
MATLRSGESTLGHTGTLLPETRSGGQSPGTQGRGHASRLRSPIRCSTLHRVEPSEEIRRLIERWTRAHIEGDHESALARLSELPDTLIIGNDPNEWWHGDEARAIWTRQLEELGSFPVTSYEVEAWEEGTVGWACVKETVTSLSGSFDGRATYVLHLERGEWKVVHVHWSLAKPNVEFLGRELTTSLEELELTVQREQPDLSATLAADGTVTIVFTDIVDSTVLLSRLGDRAWRDLILRHNAVIEEATANHRGTVVKTEGDGSMLAFSSARRAVACAETIQREIASAFPDGSPPIRVRIGVHTGDALNEADDFFGTTVHYAARVASEALGGEILVSSVVHQLVADPDIDFLDGRDVQLKGLDGLHRLFPVDLEKAARRPA